MDFISLTDIVMAVSALGTLSLAFIAYYQLRYIKNQNKPELILQRISTSDYILRNIGNGIAFNFKIEVEGKIKNRATVLNPTEFLKFTIPRDDLTRVALQNESILVFSVNYSSQYQTNLQEHFTLNLSQKNKYELNLDPESPKDKPKDDFQFKLI